MSIQGNIVMDSINIHIPKKKCIVVHGNGSEALEIIIPGGDFKKNSEADLPTRFSTVFAESET